MGIFGSNKTKSTHYCLYWKCRNCLEINKVQTSLELTLPYETYLRTVNEVINVPQLIECKNCTGYNVMDLASVSQPSEHINHNKSKPNSTIIRNKQEEIDDDYFKSNKHKSSNNQASDQLFFNKK